MVLCMGCLILTTKPCFPITLISINGIVMQFCWRILTHMHTLLLNVAKKRTAYTKSRVAQITATKATRRLNLLRHSLWGCSSLVKALVYNSSIRPVLEYAAQVWNPHTTKNITAIESVQRRAAHWAAGSQWNPDLKSWTKSSADCMSSLKWPTLETRIYLCVAFLYDILHKRYSSLRFDSFYKFKSSCTRQHSLCIAPLQATINVYRYSFFVNTPFIWNSVPHSILCITKVESFRRALKTYFLVS